MVSSPVVATSVVVSSVVVSGVVPSGGAGGAGGLTINKPDVAVVNSPIVKEEDEYRRSNVSNRHHPNTSGMEVFKLSAIIKDCF